MDAGTIYFEALSQTGANIGKALQEVVDRKNQRKQVTDLIDFYSKMPSDPGAPAGTPGSKPLFDPKTAEKMRSFIGTHDAMDAGFIAAYTKSAQAIAQAGAKARLASEQIRPMYGLDASGNVVQLGERDEHGHPHIYPKWAVEPNATPTGPDKQFQTSLGKYGMNPEDLQSVNEVHYLDQNKDPLIAEKSRTKGRHHIMGMHFGGKEVTKKRKPEEMEKEAQFVKGKTSTGKTFGPVPINQWRAWQNMTKGAQGRQQQLRKGPVRVRTREEALRLPPGTPIITPSGRTLITPRVQQPGQQRQMQPQTGEEEEDAGTDESTDE